jgi:hypothetical protein
MSNDSESPKPISFFDTMSEAGRELSPVSYRFIITRPTAASVPTRLAKSRFYRADSFMCLQYHKPISKVLPPDGKS